MTVRVGLVALALAASAVSACGNSGSPGTSSSTLVKATATAPGASTSAITSAAATTTETTEPEAITQLVGFTSPSGNVGCMLDPSYVRCDITDRNWTPPPRPADCEFDYGQGIGMGVGEKAEFVCAGDTAMGNGAPLAYGQSLTKGSLSCSSAEAGITCKDTTTGHGFTIAREAYKVF
jgi:hypothetical protein